MSENILKDIRLAEKEIERKRQQAKEQAAQILRSAEANAYHWVEVSVRSLKEQEEQRLRAFGEELRRRSQENNELTKKRVQELWDKTRERSAPAVEFVYKEFFKAVC